jgi:hypothetical protein
MAPSWVLDESKRPLLVVHLDDASTGVAPDLDSLLRALARVVELARAQPIKLLLDLTGASPDADRRRRVAQWLEGDASEVRDRITSSAIVAPSALLRGTITAIRWFFPDRVMRSETFDTRERALAWLTSR